MTIRQWSIFKWHGLHRALDRWAQLSSTAKRVPVVLNRHLCCDHSVDLVSLFCHHRR